MRIFTSLGDDWLRHAMEERPLQSTMDNLVTEFVEF